jgi:large subunit ribosomal protein L22
MAVKTNERPGTRAQVRYVRMSASKARVVLNLIRNKHVAEADQILAFSERLAAQVIGKCLRSAVANAANNDEIPAEELYVSACYADEGPTLKRFRPRARGRAGRIHKQTCHITIVVSRYDDEELDALRRQAELRGESSGRSADATASRARRVARSRKATEEAEVEEVEDTVEDTVTEEVVEDTADEATEDATEKEES